MKLLNYITKFIIYKKIFIYFIKRLCYFIKCLNNFTNCPNYFIKRHGSYFINLAIICFIKLSIHLIKWPISRSKFCEMAVLKLSRQKVATACFRFRAGVFGGNQVLAYRSHLTEKFLNGICLRTFISLLFGRFYRKVSVFSGSATNQNKRVSKQKWAKIFVSSLLGRKTAKGRSSKERGKECWVMLRKERSEKLSEKSKKDPGCFRISTKP